MLLKLFDQLCTYTLSGTTGSAARNGYWSTFPLCEMSLSLNVPLFFAIDVANDKIRSELPNIRRPKLICLVP